MGALDLIKDIAEAGLPSPYDKLVGLAHAGYDGSAAAWDAVTGDSEHAKEHATDLAWDFAGLVPGLDKPVAGYQAAKDAADTFGIGKSATEEAPRPTYDGGESAGWGGALGMGLLAATGPLGMLTGAALGGGIGGGLGVLNRPNASGGFLDPSLAAQAAHIANPNAGYDGDEAHPYSSAGPGPYDHYAE
jgi:hypothetical protein